MKYSIGNLKFKTKKECYDYTLQIIKALNECVIDSHHEKFNFFIDLFNNHPNKDEKLNGMSIIAFVIKMHNQYNHLQMFIKTENNDLINFSYKLCCEFRPRSPSYFLKSAMRFAITDQINEFRAKYKPLKCVNCTENSTTAEYHVDHNNPSFQELYKTFTTENDFIFGKFDEDQLTNRSKFHKDDSEYEDKWKDYHKNNCNLQILCKQCNLRKGK